jgi:hypothetical protein
MFEAAQSGTLFLDEIGEVSPAMQAKLLRAIQGREVMRLGETKGRPFDVRLVAATNRDLDLHGESPLAGTWPHVVTGLQCRCPLTTGVGRVRNRRQPRAGVGLASGLIAPLKVYATRRRRTEQWVSRDPELLRHFSTSHAPSEV